MAMFDRDGDGTLDKEEIKAFKDYWTSATSKPGTAAGDPGQLDAAVGAGATSEPLPIGCGCPGGFCCCRCGSAKGGR